MRRLALFAMAAVVAGACSSESVSRQHSRSRWPARSSDDGATRRCGAQPERPLVRWSGGLHCRAGRACSRGLKSSGQAIIQIAEDGDSP